MKKDKELPGSPACVVHLIHPQDFLQTYDTYPLATNNHLAVFCEILGGVVNRTGFFGEAFFVEREGERCL